VKQINVNSRTYNWPNAPTVVVCIDGSEPDYIERAVADGVMPFTKGMLQRGADLRVDCVVPSFTNPNNLSIVTGQPPSVHGISGNYFLDPETGNEVMMNEARFLGAPTIFQAFQNEGASICIITAKDKLRGLLGNGLVYGEGGAVCFSSEKADQVTFEENGIQGIVDLVGMSVPDVYSAELSEFVFAAGVKLMQGANAFYAMMDGYWAELDKAGAVLALTADHGMNAKHDNAGQPDVIYLQDHLDAWLGEGNARVILPITDPYVVHHGALGSFATAYLPAGADVNDVLSRVRNIEGIEYAQDCASACKRFQLPQERLGDIVVISTRNKVVGTSESNHDLSGLEVPLRSHGGISEQVVPLIVSQPLESSAPRDGLRNFDAFDLVLNHLAA